MPAERGSAAGRDRPQRSVLHRGESMRLPIRVTLRADDVRELEVRTSDRDCRAPRHGAHRLSRRQCAHARQEVGMRDPGLTGRDVEIPSGRIEGAMAQPQLNRAQVLARFQRMGGIAVAQRILTLPMNRPQPSFTTVTTPSTANT